jgi:hypothetical protein
MGRSPEITLNWKRLEGLILEEQERTPLVLDRELLQGRVACPVFYLTRRILGNRHWLSVLKYGMRR